MDEYMKPADVRLFQDMRKVGRITMFRVSRCQRCGGETLKGTKYCTKRCFLIAKELGMEGKRWDEACAELFGKKITLETTDGMYLTGKLTQVGTTPLDMNGEQILLPDFLELDADQEKRVDIDRLKSVKAV